ncbi:probable oxaloacetate/sulfate carrier [Cephalotrichum gorgonifer]|uniref:Probable oxaloacetate/sulfate carrier n=1 Tax=Cephalotrichum gorgonifer TaxID=2041049 RepID=A0AAE8SU54_9PEZI|nr:probable oxaloacetate/sulfate carrier [Cephalotrichum gorgonifer]
MAVNVFRAPLEKAQSNKSSNLARKWYLASAFIAGGIAACGAVTATHPFETVKIRMQLQGELQSKGHQPHHYRGPLHGVSVIVRNEGLRGIYRGLGTAYIYQILLNGCRLGFYEPMRRPLTKLIFGDSNVQSMGVNMVCGAASGVIGAAAGSPFFLVKTRLQSFSPHLAVGTQHRYRNLVDGMSQIYKSEGFGGLYRGIGAAMLRTGVGSSVQLPTYFFAKRRLMRHLGMEEGPALHLTSSAISGFVVCCFMHPPDTIMSRLYNQNGNLYSGVVDCLSKTIRTEGFFAIYKGFLPHLARILPHTILTLSLAEQTLKLVKGIETRILGPVVLDAEKSK